ncbi:carbon-nitrogen hydrolase family protein [Kribbella sp. ALI-6-A]|uniref:carbon-nitrogen hydrolase family protein n=1 Tax=Kribbella sp. ALI-6-A TaxID=1933817 RepID=UPI00192D0D7D|nr:carbon-nitrogen hydrolase family protein [Kribbella sp. ALI-6-A]
MPEPTTLRIAVAQSTVRQDPTDPAALRESGAEVRTQMKQAAKAGARLVHFPEGALCFPSKYVMSELGPDEVGPADWTKAQWPVLDAELASIAALSADLGIWTAIASLHQLRDARPHNSLYVFDDHGKRVTRYDERTLSTTKLNFMYTPGTKPITFDLDGYRFGLAVGMDAHIPEIFIDYVRRDVDAVLLSYATTGLTAGQDAVAAVAPANAAINHYWLSLAVSTNPDLPETTAGILNSAGQWVTQCPTDATSAVTTYDLHKNNALNDSARAWRQAARARVTS